MKKVFEMPGNSRVWIYQADRVLTDTEASKLSSMAATFLAEWTSHGAMMDAAIELFHHRILVVATDEAKALASGCGIDKSVGFVKSAGHEFGVDFFRRTLILFRDENGDIMEKELNQFWAMKKAGLIEDSTIVFDNTVKNVEQLKTLWEIPFSRSWHAEMWLR